MNDLQSALMALGYRKPADEQSDERLHYVPYTTYTTEGRLQIEYRVQTVYDTLRRNVIKTNEAKKLRYCL